LCAFNWFACVPLSLCLNGGSRWQHYTEGRREPMGEALPFFLTWLVTWLALMAYLWRLEAKLRAIERKESSPS